MRLDWSSFGEVEGENSDYNWASTSEFPLKIEMVGSDDTKLCGFNE